MDIKNFPNNQNVEVGAQNLMKFLHGRTSGVFAADNNARVTASVPAGMSVQVSDGIGWISNGEGDGTAWWIENQKTTGENITLPIDTAGLALPRIDRVVISWQTIDYVALPQISILKGQEASQPKAPALTNSNIIRQISLARILIPAGALKITADMITDERLDPSVCGLVTETATLDTGAVYAQLSALLDNLQKDIQAVKDGTAYVFKSGDTMTGPLKLTPPQADDDAVNRGAMTQAIMASTKVQTVTLTSDGWSGERQIVSVPGFLQKYNGTCGPSGTKADTEAYADALIFIAEERDGEVVFGYVNKPEVSISVDIIFHTGGIS